MSKNIRFIDSQYNDLFSIPDGGMMLDAVEEFELEVVSVNTLDITRTFLGQHRITA